VNSRAYILLAITTLCWGGNAVAGKLAVGHISPMVLTMLRWALASAVIFTISIPYIKRDWHMVRPRILYFLALGAIGFTIFNAMLYSALNYTSAINAVVIQAGIPMFIFGLNYLLFRTRVSYGQIIGFFLTIISVGLLASQGELQRLLHMTLNFGDGLMIIAIIAYSIYTIILRWKPPVNWRTLMAFSSLGALLASFPGLFWEVHNNTAIWPDTFGWITVLYTVIFASLTAQVLYVMGVDLIGPNRAGLFINLIPVFGTLLSVAILGETLHAYQLAALILAFCGIAVAERKKPPVS
jgi:drug/metabolite transporter (DMT)-like permease